MSQFEYRGDDMFCEGVALSRIAAEMGTPCFVYSRASIVDRVRRLRDAWPRDRTATIAYAMRANPSRGVLSVIEPEGAWLSISSGGEMMQAFRSGFSPGRMVYSGLHKGEEEIELALAKSLYLTVADSRSELDRLSRSAIQAHTRARIAIRVSSGDEPTKVGIDLARAEEVFRHAADTEGLEVIGVHQYVGRHEEDAGTWLGILGGTLALVDRLAAAGVMITVLDIGSSAGSLMLDPAFCQGVVERIGSRPIRVISEPGRLVVADAGVLLARVLYLKESGEKRWLVMDAGMSDLPTPALFQSRHEIVPARRFDPPDAPLYDVVGPLMEGSDVLGHERALAGVVPGDLLVVKATGAFDRALSSNYCFRMRPPEVMVDGDSVQLVRRRETFQDLVRTEADSA